MIPSERDPAPFAAMRAGPINEGNMTDLIRREDAVAACDSLKLHKDATVSVWYARACDDVAAALRSLPSFEPVGPSEEEVAEAMHEERQLREGCRTTYAAKLWAESKAVRDRWTATARVAIAMLRGKP